VLAFQQSHDEQNQASTDKRSKELLGGGLNCPFALLQPAGNEIACNACKEYQQADCESFRHKIFDSRLSDRFSYLHFYF
jgi:hypothetical protein